MILMKEYLDKPSLSRLSADCNQRLYSSKPDAQKFALWEEAIAGLYVVKDKDERYMQYSESRYVVDVSKLPRLFENKQSKLVPLCLPHVIAAMYKQGKIAPKYGFENRNSWISWTFRIVKDNVSDTTEIDNGYYVLMDGLNEDSDRAYNHLRQHLEETQCKIVDLDKAYSILEEHVGNGYNEKDIDMIVQNLENNRRISCKVVNGNRFISMNGPVSDEDIRQYEVGVAEKKKMQETNHRLKQVECMLNKKLVDISAKIESERGMALKRSKLGNTQIALLHIKRKKSWEGMYGRVMGQIDNIESMSSSIEMAVSNRDVHAALVGGNKILESINMNPEKIQRDLAEFAINIDQAETVSQILSDGYKASDTLVMVDEEDLESELELLVQESYGYVSLDGADVGERIVQGLPSVPSVNVPIENVATAVVDEEGEKLARELESKMKLLA